MMFWRLLWNMASPIVGHAPDWDNSVSWRTSWPSVSWFLALAAALGIFEAFFIVIGNWLIVAGLTLLAPAILLFNLYPFAAFILWLLVNPFLQTTPDHQSRAIYWIFYRALPPLVLCLAIITFRLRQGVNHLRIKLSLDIPIMIAFLVWALVNIFWYHPSGFLPYAFTLYDQSFVPFCLYWWIRIASPTERDLKRLIPVACFLVIFEVGVGLVSWLQPGLLPKDWVGYTSGRTIGTLRFVHAYSLTLLFFTLLILQAAISNKSKGLRLLLLFVVGVGIIGIFLSFSRGAWLGALAATLGVLLLYPKSVLRLTLVLLIVMFILGKTVFSDHMSYALERLNSEQTAKVRLVIWDAGMQMIRLKPWFGWGYKDYSIYAGQFQRVVADTAATRYEASHNTFISFAAELGVPGLFLYLFPAIWWLGVSFKRRRNLVSVGFWSHKLLVLFWLMLLAHSITSGFSDIRTSQYGLSLWWVCLAWIATIVDPFSPAA